MFRRYWHIGLAIGIASLFSLIPHDNASAHWAKPQTSGISHPSPYPKEKGNREGDCHNDSPAPLPVTIVESPAQAISRERSEADSASHEAKDLDAQVRAANAAEKQVLPSWLGAFLSGFGTIGVVLALIQGQKALKVARKANKIARISMKTLERPYLTIKATEPPAKPKPFDCTKDITFSLKNFGRSQAIITHVFVGIQSVWKTGEEGYKDPEAVVGRAIGRGLVIPPDDESETFQAQVWMDEDGPTYDLIQQGGYLHGFVRYEDAFGKRHVTGFALLYSENTRSFHIPVTHDKNANYSRSDKAAVRLGKPADAAAEQAVA